MQQNPLHSIYLHSMLCRGLFMPFCRIQTAVALPLSVPARIHSSNSFSTSSIQIRTLASLGIRRSPLGETATDPTFGPSGRHERLNCCEKNLR